MEDFCHFQLKIYTLGRGIPIQTSETSDMFLEETSGTVQLVMEKFLKTSNLAVLAKTKLQNKEISLRMKTLQLFQCIGFQLLGGKIDG